MTSVQRILKLEAGFGDKAEGREEEDSLNSLQIAKPQVSGPLDKLITTLNALNALHGKVDPSAKSAIEALVAKCSPWLPDLVLEIDSARLENPLVKEFISSYQVYIPRKWVCTVTMPAKLDWIEMAIQANEVSSKLGERQIVDTGMLLKWADLPSFIRPTSEPTQFTVDAFVVGSNGLTVPEQKKFWPLVETERFLAAYVAYGVVTGQDMLHGNETRTHSRTLRRGPDGLEQIPTRNVKTEWFVDNQATTRRGIAKEITPPVIPV